MAKYEEKFIVINTKIFEDDSDIQAYIIENFDQALIGLQEEYFKTTGKKLEDKKYYVCNQDEPYAQKVIDIILEGENNKNK
jgi:hypothetical protein